MFTNEWKQCEREKFVMRGGGCLDTAQQWSLNECGEGELEISF